MVSQYAVYDQPSKMVVSVSAQDGVQDTAQAKAESTKIDKVAYNCWLFVKQKYPDLPNTEIILDNLTPTFGPIAVFKYGELYHYAIVEGQGMGEFYISESNFKKGEYSKRTIRWSDPHFLGFYTP